MVTERERTQSSVKVFLAILFIVFLTVYYNVNNSVSIDYDAKRTETETGITSAVNLIANATKNLKPNQELKISPLPKGYLVWGENCHIASMNPFASHYMEDYTEEKGPTCSKNEPLVTKSFHKLLNSYILHINYNLKNQYLNESNMDEDIFCCYKQVLRWDGDKNYKLLDCKKFEQNFMVPNDIDYMLIECSLTRNTTVVYQDGFSFVQQRLPMIEKLESNTEPRRPFGILMFGIDSTSQFNIRRVMPRTYQQIHNHGWFELSGYNKIGDNTLPNLMAVLAGFDLETANELCHYHEKGGLDKCPTLFKLFREQGFVTAYSEDSGEISTFDYLLPGFQEPPTDYYQRPLLLAAEEHLPSQKLSGLTYCVGPRRYGEYIYDFGVEFAERFLGQSIFGLFWTNSFSHNHWSDPGTMDERMVEYFHYMESNNIFDNNVVILFSDHGCRWGFLRNQKEGYNEERLPMFFMKLPQWLQDQHPEIVQSLTLNRNRLTSPYDLHMTLQHLAMMSLGKNQPIDPPVSCPSCQTLLKPVAENRTCQLAGITDHWCTCIPFEVIDRDTEQMENMTNLVIDEMNNYLMENGFGEKCAKLVFKRNVEANLKLDLHTDVHKSRIQEYRMQFEANPNEGDFDATFLYDTETKSIGLDVTEISRLNRYAEDSACIEDKIAKKYCICKDSIKENR